MRKRAILRTMKDGKRESLIEVDVVVAEEQREAFFAKLHGAIDELRHNRSLRNLRVEQGPAGEAETGTGASIRAWPII